QYDIEYINPVIEQEFGPINGRKCYEYFHDRREACPWCKNTDVFAGKSVQWEWHSSKNDRYYDLFDTQFMNADGSISKFEIFRDITKRKKAEQNIRDLAHIVESSLNEIYIFDAETFKFVQVNYGACENIGYTLEELTNLTPLDIKPKFTKESFMQLVEPLKSGAKKILILETVHKRKDGSLYDVEVHLQLSDFISKPVFVAIILDITERKKAEEALRSSEVQKNAILNGITSNIALVDKDLKILWVNKVGAASVNKLPEEMIGHTCHAFWADPGKPCDKCPTLRAFQTKQSEHVIMNTPDGRVWDERGEPVFDAEGNVVAMVEIAEDITDQKRMEEELIKEKRMESVGLLAGGIAHDFNNLLTVIFGNIKMIKMFCSPDEKMGQYLKASEKSLEDAKALTNQLLTFSRGGEPVKEIASIGGILKDIVNFNLHGARIKPQFSIDEGLWNAEVDVGQIKQIISNLVINALQAMPGSGNLYVKASNSIVDEENKIGNLEEGKYIHFSIKDEGIGISKGVLSQIFNPFFSSKKEGRGLGLSVCHSIVKKHNGFITAESETDKGTTFHVYLPAIEKELSLKVNKEVKPKVELSLKILIMDDEEDITTMLGDFFKRTGCQIEIASDGKEAIEKYKKAKEIGHKFDAVLLDLTIPGGMGGQETLEELKKHDRDVKAFVMSGYSNDPVMSDYEEYGFKGIIQKPFDLEDVVDVIKKAVEGA
ncbi:MAG: PAS domain S-box protein, partial [Candidatus Aureabacteria bacterium]|nr:PAS domain S-box protein [Candidatus Auribacterota bacterium]